MSYLEIFIFGWNLNAFMFVVNMLLAIRVIKSKDQETLQQENEELQKLKTKFDECYPNRKYETLITYLIPFTAFFRMSFRILEMLSFFSRNSGTTLYDFMVYKYITEIEKAQHHD